MLLPVSYPPVDAVSDVSSVGAAVREKHRRQILLISVGPTTSSSKMTHLLAREAEGGKSYWSGHNY